jgi:hypothetical protein
VYLTALPMAKLNAAAKSKLDKLEASNGPTDDTKNGNVNKNLPLNPDEQAGLREQKRHYTKELLSHRPPEIDPNHAYPNAKDCTTLVLSMFLWSLWLIALAGLNPVLDIKCGPLLRYVWTDYSSQRGPFALYTMLIVTDDTKSNYTIPPTLEIAGINTAENATATKLKPEILHQERGYTFWRWKIYLTLIAEERRLAYRINGNKENLGFWVPGANQSMRMMFYSCNGSLSLFDFNA